jgi:outer membrane receptor protein involved in Fe transport
MKSFAAAVNRSFRVSVRNAVRVLGTSVGVLVLSLPAFAQGNAGRILGAVTDQTGASVVGATVIVTDLQRGITRNLTTDQAGEYFAPNLLPGTYKVRAESKGFKAIERVNIGLEVGNDVRIDLVLPAGEISEVVQVMEEVPLVDTTSAILGGTIDNKTINDLPLNGRDYQKLLTLRPGVMIYPGGGGWDQSANGVRPESNAYMVDGMTDDEPFSALSVINAPGLVGDAVTVIPIDAIQEFNTQINPKAEYGWKPGVTVTVGLKSGTNSIHGTAYAFGRSDSFDARNYFNPGPQPKVPLDFQQFGATGGGAIIKDKLFYFVGYEGQRYSVGNSFLVTVPTTASVAGATNCTYIPAGDCSVSIRDAELDLAAYTGGAMPLSKQSLGLLPLYPANAGQSSQVTIGFPNVNSSDSVLGKIDYHMNDRHTFNGMVFWGRDAEVAQDQAFLQPQWLSTQSQKPITGGGNWTWTPNSQWVNEARFGYVYDNKANLAQDHAVPATAYGLNTGVTDPLRFGMPQINVAPFNSLGGGVNWPKFQGPDAVYQGSDYVSYLRGKHAFKFGAEIRHFSVNEGSFRGSKGQIFFNGGGAFAGSSDLEDFLAGDPTFGKITYGNPQRHETQWLYAGFFQDDWRVTPNFTLNLGLRYEYETPIREDHNLLGNFDPNLGLVQVGHQISSPYNPDHTQFAPRVGFAWDITGKGTTVLRGGGGILYDTISMETLLVQENVQNATTIGLATIPTGAPIVVNGVTTPGPGTIAVSSVVIPSGPGGLNWNGSSVGGSPIFPAAPIQCGDGNPAFNDPQPCNVLGIDRNFRTPFISTWTLGVQRTLTRNLALDVAYVGNYSGNLIGIRDINQGVPAPGTAPTTALPGPYTAKFPYLGFINMMSNQYGSNYNGLQVTMTQRTTHGLSFLLGYTYSHALDYSSTNQNQFLPQDSTHPAAEYASSDYDIRHRFTLSLTYAIPGKKSFAQMLEGWQINTVTTLQSAQPWTVNDTVDNIDGTNENAGRWDFFGNPSDFGSGPNPIPYYAPGSSNMPGACTSNAAALGAGGTASLNAFGCYAQGHSVMIPPAFGTFGTMGRNMFRDSGFRDLDLSVTKDWKFRERLTAQFRAEFFNVLNHPSFANPYGGTSGYGPGAFDDPSSIGSFGCGCATPDQAGGNPVVGSGSNRAIQFGLKLSF